MQYSFANRIEDLKPSAIREMLKVTSGQGVISFAAGNPAGDSISSADILRLAEEILTENPMAALQYSITEGYTPLRDFLRLDLKRRWNIGTQEDDLIITAGAQQVMDLCTKALCNEGDTIICEEPSFIGALNAFRSYGVRLAGVPVDENGMDMQALEARLKTCKNVRFIYTIPNFQNPTGVCLSMERRRQMYALAQKYNCLILEDNPYGDIRFSGEDIPCIKSLDTDGRVIYAGSFSKVVSPGLRVGYCLAAAPLIARFTACKQVSDVHTGILNQMICHRFVTELDFTAHLKRIRAIYKGKAEWMQNCADRFLPQGVTYHPVSGGMFLWVTMPPEIDVAALCAALVKRGVAAVPGNTFYTDLTRRTDSIRLNYATPTAEEIEIGLEILGNTIREFMR
ncbi:MAG: PLP-dependent aminotransferase family protein [Clostridia bacterium]|nr:PLP-dependent aminotransferase family protein [Clostridia bacterium]